MYVRGAFSEAGYAFKNDIFDILCGFGLGVRIIQYTVAYSLEAINDDDPNLLSIYSEIAIRLHPVSKNVFASISFHDYLTNTTRGGKEKNTVVKFGLGLSL